MGKMPKGLPKSYIKRWGISKLAWRKFRAGALTKGIRTRTKAIKRRIRRSRRRSNPARKRGGRRMVRRYRRKRRRGGKSMTRTAFKLIRLGALVAPGISVYASSTEAPMRRIARALLMYSGHDPDGRFDGAILAHAWGPFLITTLATYGIPKIAGIIRRL